MLPSHEPEPQKKASVPRSDMLQPGMDLWRELKSYSSLYPLQPPSTAHASCQRERWQPQLPLWPQAPWHPWHSLVSEVPFPGESCVSPPAGSPGCFSYLSTDRPTFSKALGCCSDLRMDRSSTLQLSFVVLASWQDEPSAVLRLWYPPPAAEMLPSWAGPQNLGLSTPSCVGSSLLFLWFHPNTLQSW